MGKSLLLRCSLLSPREAFLAVRLSSFPALSRAYKHTRLTHTCARTRTKANMPVHTHARTGERTQHAHVNTRTHIYTQICTLTRVCIHKRQHTYPLESLKEVMVQNTTALGDLPSSYVWERFSTSAYWFTSFSLLPHSTVWTPHKVLRCR